MKTKALLFLTFFINPFLNAQWTQKASMPSTPRCGSVAFSIAAKGYVGCGSDLTTGLNFNDFWEWDQGTNVWTQRANFPGIMCLLGAGWSINGKGYFASGCDAGYAPVAELWEYDPGPNTWAQKANVPSGGMAYTVGWAIGNYGYICSGQDINGAWSPDLWEWDQGTNTWLQKAGMPGPPRVLSTGFAVGTKGYIATGLDQTYVTINDCWEWDQGTNTWMQKASILGSNRHESNAFALASTAYLGTGDFDYMATLQDMQSYDPSTNTWTVLPNFPGPARELPTMFSIGCAGYVFGGWDEQTFSGNNIFNDLWEFNSGGPTAAVSVNNDSICNGSTATITASGGTGYSWNTGATTSTISVTPSANTTYTVYVTNGGPCSSTASVNIFVFQPPLAAIAGVDTICPNTSATLTGSGGTNYSWSTGATTASITVNPTITTTYTLVAASGTCTPDSTTHMIVVLPGTNISISIPDQIVCSGTAVTLTANPTGGAPWYTYSWVTLSGNDTITSLNPSFTITPTDTDTYMIVIIDRCNNSNEDTVTISVHACDITIPNVITPNGDGFNGLFIVKNLEEFPGSQLVIYNRWGTRIYESSDYRNDWNGGGESDGTYYYVLHVSDGKDHAGYLTILNGK